MHRKLRLSSTCNKANHRYRRGMTYAILEADRSLPLLELTSIGLLEWAACEAPDRIALKQPAHGGAPEIVWTYAEMLRDSRSIAAFFARHFNPGDHVAIWAANSAPWFLYQYAAAQLGLVLVTLNPAMREYEIEFMLARSEAKGVVLERSYRGADLIAILDAVRPRLPRLDHVHYLDQWRDHVAQGTMLPALPPSPARPEDPAIIVFTSGTTGRPKAAMLSHRGTVNIARIGAERLGLPTGLTWLATLPVYHVGGPVTLCLGAVSQLNTLVVMPPFDPGVVLRLIGQERINYMPLVPAMLIPMIEHPDFESTDLGALQAILVGGTTITPAFVQLGRGRTGADMQVVYGITEGCGEITKTDRTDAVDTICETVGTPLAHTDLKIVRPETGEIAERDEIGEIRFRSPYMTLGYFGDAEATAALFDEQGYVRSGDLGLIDADGRVRIAGRLKEMIIRGGVNIYPREIEDALADFPGIAESAVVGVAHERLGEEVAVAVRAASGGAVDVDAARAFLEARLARYKVPKHWRVIDDFPRNASGKIKKFELREIFAAEPSA
jgi:fatty-acyl-CoA synthase